MQAPEFISYTSTPADPYMVGFAKYRVTMGLPGSTPQNPKLGRFIVVYKIVRKKDGTGNFPVPGTLTITEDGKKEYVKMFEADSRTDEVIMSEYIRESIRKAGQRPQASPTPPPQPSYGQSNEPFMQEQNLPF